ncbi:MAPEG family protein [Paracoccus suum]|uniref:MAPEG family protein n=1 Tax=Paracoccus suum TaxID=2259340 RepID=A0A344PPM5_9RHOB|nr:MAPEG family protein [Paracoccus suum]AXC51330.1 MAPEG family protein [Paracoccus suum]
MTAELTALGLAALLQAAQIGVAAMSLNRDVGAEWNAGPRDTEPKLSPMTGRLRRAVDNHFEGLAFFTIAVVMVTLSGEQSGLTRACAWAYLAARVLYVPAYALGWTPWRSIIWAVGFLATMAMIVASLF